jgi:hypothetical protein
MMGRAYEYTTHSFCSFNVHSFIGYLQSLANSGSNGIEEEEFSIPRFSNTGPAISKNKGKSTEITTTNKRLDYTLRTTLSTDRYKVSERQPTYLFQNGDTPAETLADMSPYEFHFWAQKKKKPKCQDSRGRTCAYVMQPNECSLSPEHPQYDTHVMVVQDVSNPKKPHVIPNMFGYVLPNVANDPEKYYLIMMSLFSPYHSEDNILSNPFGDDYNTYQESFRGYMSHLEENNPLKHAWLKRLMANMNTIREGKQQQQKERAQREGLKQAQGLIERDVEGPYDNVDGEEVDGTTYATETEMADVMKTLSHRYKTMLPAKVKNIVAQVSAPANIHPSKIRVLSDLFFSSLM